MEPANGRDANGRFAIGNKASLGNPYTQKVAELRAVLMAATSKRDMVEIWAALLLKAKDGNIAAIREVFDRTIGKPVEADLIERLAWLEDHLHRAMEGKEWGNGRTK